MLLNIVTLPDPVLSAQAEPVTVFDEKLKEMVSDMFETLYAAPGVGLAAPQVGVSKQLVVIDLFPGGIKSDEDKEWFEEQKAGGYTGPLVLVNPQIVEKSGAISFEEGCLSLPGVSWEVKRAEHVLVKAQNVEGEPITIDATGFFAVCIQHELDHLKGLTLVNYMPRLKMAAVIRRLRKRKAEE